MTGARVLTALTDDNALRVINAVVMQALAYDQDRRECNDVYAALERAKEDDDIGTEAQTLQAYYDRQLVRVDAQHSLLVSLVSHLTAPRTFVGVVSGAYGDGPEFRVRVDWSPGVAMVSVHVEVVD